MPNVSIRGWYKHFKGRYYFVVGEGIHTETREKLVIYRQQDVDILQARPYDMFFEEGRFTRVSKDE